MPGVKLIFLDHTAEIKPQLVIIFYCIVCTEVGYFHTEGKESRLDLRSQSQMRTIPRGIIPGVFGKASAMTSKLIMLYWLVMTIKT